MTLRGNAKFRGRLARGLKNDTTNFDNFRTSSRKSKNVHFDWLLLSKTYKN